MPKSKFFFFFWIAEFEEPPSDKSNILPPAHLNQIENGLDLREWVSCSKACFRCKKMSPICSCRLSYGLALKNHLSKFLKYFHTFFWVGPKETPNTLLSEIWAAGCRLLDPHIFCNWAGFQHLVGSVWSSFSPFVFWVCLSKWLDQIFQNCFNVSCLCGAQCAGPRNVLVVTLLSDKNPILKCIDSKKI